MDRLYLLTSFQQRVIDETDEEISGNAENVKVRCFQEYVTLHSVRTMSKLMFVAVFVHRLFLLLP